MMHMYDEGRPGVIVVIQVWLLQLCAGARTAMVVVMVTQVWLE